MTIISLAARRTAATTPVAEGTTAGTAEMSLVERDARALEAPAAPERPDTTVLSAPAAGPVRVHGKFFFAGDDKYFVKGVTYGPFPVGSHGAQFPEVAMVGRDFALTPSPNRFGLPAFYSLHVWIWSPNPSGLFQPWNPRVHCP